MAKKNVSPFEYKEKIWGKDEGGEHIIDGYTFQGKRAFGKAQEGLMEYLRKGVVRDVNEVKIKVLDVRKIGAGTDIEIEMTENKARGIAVLKLYGPNKNNECVITINKSKESDHKYVKMLSEKVVKPLVRDFLVDNIDLDSFEDEAMGSSPEDDSPYVFKCPFCDKTWYSSPGLKCHITKKHKDKKVDDSKIEAELNDSL